MTLVFVFITGMSLPNNQPNNNDPNVIAYQANLHRAFLQSAMAQNIQIQQQLLAQNQALNQLLRQQVNTSQVVIRLIFFKYNKL